MPVKSAFCADVRMCEDEEGKRGLGTVGASAAAAAPEHPTLPALLPLRLKEQRACAASQVRSVSAQRSRTSQRDAKASFNDALAMHALCRRAWNRVAWIPFPREKSC